MDISFIVIGYNEATFLETCLASIQQADLGNLSYEVIYVDGGSSDSSRRIAETAGVDILLGGERRRRAAENRNLGIQHARGNLIQLLDGDMTLTPGWPRSALEFFRTTPVAAAVCGELKETNPSLLFQAFQIDWRQNPGEVASCGGAAMWRRDILLQAGGFPEFVTYGEEPYLCWRIRNEFNYKIYYLNQSMAVHNLGFRGILDYLRRGVRVGESYAEIASLCFRTNDKFWLKEAVLNPLWAFFLIISIVLLCFASLPIRFSIAGFFFLIFGRKLLQLLYKGYSFAVSVVYTAHVYGSKIPITWGEFRWFYRSVVKRLKKTPAP